MTNETTLELPKAKAAVNSFCNTYDSSNVKEIFNKHNGCYTKPSFEIKYLPRMTNPGQAAAYCQYPYFLVISFSLPSVPQYGSAIVTPEAHKVHSALPVISVKHKAYARLLAGPRR